MNSWSPGLLLSSLLLTVLAVGPCTARDKVRVGADLLIEKHLAVLEGKRVGLITNQTGRLSSGDFLADELLARGIRVVALFSPEHGIRGEIPDGVSIRHDTDSRTGLPIHSLYGSVKKPTPEMLAGLDVLVYDIQDVGARFYTYISTMTLAMQAAADADIPFVVLDRPNPIAILGAQGPVMEDSLKSFVGMLPLPVIYGLTCGELAEMINGEGWLGDGRRVALTVVRMEGWTRSMPWDSTGLSWIRPSPNIPTPMTAVVYPATCFLEATNISEGRGTIRPFQTVGAPFVDGAALAEALNQLELPGVVFTATSFHPSSSKYAGQECQGVFLEITDPARFRPVHTGLSLLQTLRKLSHSSFRITAGSFKRLLGSSRAYEMFMDGATPDRIERFLGDEQERYLRLASRYEFYPSR